MKMRKKTVFRAILFLFILYSCIDIFFINPYYDKKRKRRVAEFGRSSVNMKWIAWYVGMYKFAHNAFPSSFAQLVAEVEDDSELRKNFLKVRTHGKSLRDAKAENLDLEVYSDYILFPTNSGFENAIIMEKPGIRVPGEALVCIASADAFRNTNGYDSAFLKIELFKDRK